MYGTVDNPITIDDDSDDFGDGDDEDVRPLETTVKDEPETTVKDETDTGEETDTRDDTEDPVAKQVTHPTLLPTVLHPINSTLHSTLLQVLEDVVQQRGYVVIKGVLTTPKGKGGWWKNIPGHTRNLPVTLLFFHELVSSRKDGFTRWNNRYVVWDF